MFAAFATMGATAPVRNVREGGTTCMAAQQNAALLRHYLESQGTRRHPGVHREGFPDERGDLPAGVARRDGQR
jgi:hypothetical protein